MNIFDQISHNIEQVRVNLANICVQAMVINEQLIIDLNKDQIEHGQGSDGAILGEYAWIEYAEYKQDIGSKAPFGVYDFKLKGSFLDGIYTEPQIGSDIDSSGLTISSRDKKTEKLEMLAPNVWGHTDNNKAEVQKALIEEILKNIKDGIIKT